MMTAVRLYIEFFLTGLFAVGGGLATLPFLYEMSARTGWFSNQDILNLIAVSESPPGAIGINMATYVGYHIAGIPGAVLATLGLIAPSIIVILIIAGFLARFRESKLVDSAFKGLRPASTALICAAGLSVAKNVLLHTAVLGEGEGLGRVLTGLFNWKAVALAAAVFVCMRAKPLKKLHPIVFIGISAVIGAVFRFAGA